MKFFAWLGIALLTVVNVGLSLALGYLFLSRGYVPGGGFSSAELVTIVLTSLAVILASLAVFIGLLAIFGYKYFLALAKTTATKCATEAAEKVATEAAVDAVTRLDTSENSDRDYGAAAAQENGNGRD